jgi:hypothetical protein
VDLSSTVRAHAFVAMGKLCLKDESLAKRTIQLFVRELESRSANWIVPPSATSQALELMPDVWISCCVWCSSDPIVRNNVLVIMCDLCRT